jgi:hypothetical protein
VGTTRTTSKELRSGLALRARARGPRTRISDPSLRSLLPLPLSLALFSFRFSSSGLARLSAVQTTQESHQHHHSDKALETSPLHHQHHRSGIGPTADTTLAWLLRTRWPRSGPQCPTLTETLTGRADDSAVDVGVDNSTGRKPSTTIPRHRVIAELCRIVSLSGETN